MGVEVKQKLRKEFVRNVNTENIENIENIGNLENKVKAAEVMDEGKPKPLIISCHCFLLITSTRPPRATTRLYSSYRSNT